jgi:hypothetical protein
MASMRSQLGMEKVESSLASCLPNTCMFLARTSK